MNWFIRPDVGLVQPILNPTASVPALAYCERLKSIVAVEPTKFLNGSINQSDEIFLGAKPRRHRSFLIEFTDIEEVVRIVAHGSIIRGFARGRQPKGREAGSGKFRHFQPKVSPPSKGDTLNLRTVPVER